MAMHGKDITIITGSAECKPWFLNHIKVKFPDVNFVEFDLRGRLKKDPATSVGWKEDWQYDRTQTCVIGQEGFTETIGELVDTCENEANLWINCHTGYHRASVTGKVLESQLNSLVDDDGNRLYNAILFMTHACDGRKVYAEKFQDITDWISGPWDIESEFNGLKDSMFGYRTSMSKAAAARNWNSMYEAISAKHNRGACVRNVLTRESWLPNSSVASSSAALPSHIMPPKPPPATKGIVKTPKCGPPRRPAPLPATPQHVPPAPPSPAQVLRSLPRAEWEKQMEEQEKRLEDQWPGVKKEHDEADTEHEHDESNEESGDDQTWGKWDGENLPDWATIKPNVRAWWSILDYWHIDDNARESLFALSQHSDQGYQAANELIGKLLKKKADNQTFNTSASAFIHSCVLNARNRISFCTCFDDQSAESANKRPRR